MGKKTLNTRELLTITAGELFAGHGFDVVSTRMIAEQAGVKLSAIHYHFGSKESLYVEAVKHAHHRSEGINFASIMEENSELLRTPEGQAEIIQKMVFLKFEEYFRPGRPEWESQILIRELATPTSALEVLTDEIFRPDAESAVDFHKIMKPEGSLDEAAAWSDIMHGSILLYTMGKKPIEIVRGENALNQTFFNTAARTVARAMILEASLPLPEDLQ